MESAFAILVLTVFVVLGGFYARPTTCEGLGWMCIGSKVRWTRLDCLGKPTEYKSCCAWIASLKLSIWDGDYLIGVLYSVKKLCYKSTGNTGLHDPFLDKLSRRIVSCIIMRSGGKESLHAR